MSSKRDNYKREREREREKERLRFCLKKKTKQKLLFDWGLEQWLSSKSIGCSSRGPGFNFPSITRMRAHNSNSRASDILTQTDRHAGKTPMHMDKNK